MSPLVANSGRRIGLIGVLVLAGSVLIHLAVLTRSAWVEWLALVSLMSVPMVDGLLRRRPKSWLWFLALSALAALVVYGSGAALALYLSSIALPSLMAWLFGRTLLADRMALIEQIARATRPQLPDYMAAYARRLTQMWALIFCVMTASAALLALSGQREIWSLVTNFGNYVLIAGIVCVEYAYRRWRFDHFPHPGFIEYLRILVHSNPRQHS